MPSEDRVLRSIQLILVAHICRWKSAPRVSTFERLSLAAVDISPFSPTLRARYPSYHYLWDSRSLLWAPEKCSAVSCKSILSVHSSNPPMPLARAYKLIEPTRIDEPCACSFLRLPEYSINPVPVHVQRPCHKHATLRFREAVVVYDSYPPLSRRL